MATITITTQAGWDALPAEFGESTIIEIRAADTISIARCPRNSRAVLWGNSRAELRGNSRAVLWGNSRAELRGNSRAVLRGNSSAELRDNSSAVLWDNSRAVLRGNSSAELRDNSSAVLWDNSSAELRGNSSAELRGNSRAELRGNSRAVLRGNSVGRVFSVSARVALYGFAVCFDLTESKKATIKQHAATATIITPRYAPGVQGWLAREGVKAGKSVILFKRVSADLLTQEGTTHETKWAIGATLTHPAWNPTGSECGSGKFHACARPYLCDEFRTTAGDRYVAIRVAVADLYAWDDAPQYPHKIAFRKGKVLYEVDRFGEKVGGDE